MMLLACIAAAGAGRHRLCRQPFPGVHATGLASARALYNWLPASFDRSAADSSGAETHLAARFVNTARSVGVSRIALIRHGNTLPKSGNGLDWDRVLTDKGRKQALLAGSTYGVSELKPFFATALISPAPRTTETAQLFFQAAERDTILVGGHNAPCNVASTESPATPIILKLVQSLYDKTMQPEGSTLFRKYGYAPLTTYINAEDRTDRETARKVLGEYAQTAAEIIIESLSTTLDECLVVTPPTLPNTPKDSTMFLFAHAIYLPAAAVGIAALAGCDESGQDTIVSTVTDEVACYCINLNTKSVRYLQCPA